MLNAQNVKPIHGLHPICIDEIANARKLTNT
jgi:hypothetical protein